MSRFVVSLVLFALLLTGCPGPTTATDAGGADTGASAVVGTWRRESNYGESSRTLTLVLDADGTLHATETFAVVASSAATNGGCSSSIAWVGTWSTAGANLSLVPDGGTNTTTGCNDPTMNATARASTSDELLRFGATGPFTATSTTLTFELYADPAPFARQ